jgi:hypothetical protein
MIIYWGYESIVLIFMYPFNKQVLVGLLVGDNYLLMDFGPYGMTFMDVCMLYNSYHGDAAPIEIKFDVCFFCFRFSCHCSPEKLLVLLQILF